MFAGIYLLPPPVKAANSTNRRGSVRQEAGVGGVPQKLSRREQSVVDFRLSAEV